jgi:hypothetical protein
VRLRFVTQQLARAPVHARRMAAIDIGHPRARIEHYKSNQLALGWSIRCSWTGALVVSRTTTTPEAQFSATNAMN